MNNVTPISASKFRIASSVSFTATAAFAGPPGQVASKASIGMTITFPSGRFTEVSFTEVLDSQIFNPQGRPMSVKDLIAWVDSNLQAEYCVREVPEGLILFEVFIADKGDVSRYNASNLVRYMTFDPSCLSGSDADDMRVMFH